MISDTFLETNNLHQKTNKEKLITVTSGLVWYSNGRFVSSCQMVRYWNGGLKTGLKKAFPWSKMSGIQMICPVTWLYHLNTGHPYFPVFRWIRYSGAQYSDGYYRAFLAIVTGKSPTLRSRKKNAIRGRSYKSASIAVKKRLLRRLIRRCFGSQFGRQLRPPQ